MIEVYDSIRDVPGGATKSATKTEKPRAACAARGLLGLP
jgi:hypothetical protein